MTDLQDIELTNNSALIQYVDDVLIASTNRENCVEDTSNAGCFG